MSLKTGNWKFNENGRETLLQIDNVDPVSGEVSGQMDSGIAQEQFVGLWDETSRTLSFFSPSGAQANLATNITRFHKGFLFSTPRNPVPGQDVVWTLAGFVQMASVDSAKGMGGNARRNVFGWFAQITEVA